MCYLKWPRLPYGPGGPAKFGVMMTGCEQVEEFDASKPVVLVVDDVLLVRMLIADSLRARGFEVIEAGSGEEAIRILEAEHPVGAILSDV